MANRLGAVVIIALVFAAAALCAEESGGPNESNPRQDFARTPFPVPDQVTFERDLDLLSDMLPAKVRSPAPPNHVCDRFKEHELEAVLELMRHWPCLKFHKSLAQHFMTSNAFVVPCAKALLAQRDPALREVVKTRRDYTIISGGCFPSSESVADALAKALPAEPRFDAHESLLPLKGSEEGRRECDWPEGMSIPKAAAQLQDANLSIRLQSWVWLGQRGIVPPVEPVYEAWTRLTVEQQWMIAKISPRYVGRGRLCAVYDALADVSPSVIQNRLLVRRVELGSDAAKAEARRMVRVRQSFPVAFTEEPGKSALPALCQAPEPEDIPTLIALNRCDQEWVAAAAIRGLCRLDEPAAIEELGQALIAPTRDMRYVLLEWSIQEQARNNLRYRHLYLQALATALQDRKARSKSFDLLLDAFSCISRQDFGVRGPLDVKEGIEVADRCLEWYAEHVAPSLPTTR